MEVILVIGILILFVLFNALPLLLWLKKPYALKKEFDNGTEVSWTPGFELWGSIICVFFMTRSLFCVGHGDRLYKGYGGEESDAISLILFMFVFVFAIMLAGGIMKDYKPRDFLKKGLIYWLMSLLYTGLSAGFNALLIKYPEKFHGFDEYTWHEVLTKCIPCALIGSLMELAVIVGINMLIWYIRDNKNKY